MRYYEDFERSRQISEQALAIMAKHEIPLNPANYTVWYAFASGALPKLSQSLKVLLTSKGAFTAERNIEIYEQFFGDDREAEAMDSVGSQVQRCADQLLEDLRQARIDQGSFGDKVGGLSEALGEDDGAAAVAGVVKDILMETSTIVSKSKELEQKLAKSTDEISRLRTDLQDIREEALTDALTRIANRKCFDQRLGEMATEAMEEGRPLSVLLLDIDHFKKFNDTYGHAVGDSVLKVVASQLRRSVKGQDLPARYGGEEFAVLLPNTEIIGAYQLAQKINQEIGARQLKDSKTEKSYGSVTVSIGAAEYRYGEALSGVVERADAALYTAKRNGRNRVAVESENLAAAS